MAEKQETIADIIAEKRRRADEIERDCAEKMKRGEMTSDQYARELVADIRKEADRLEAAYKREKAAIEADALAVGGIVEAMRQKEAICTKCRDGEPPKNCRFFGEPDGCSSPTYGHYPQLPIGDCAKMREALKKCLLYIACAESVGIGTITLNDKVKLDPKKIIKSAKEALAATKKERGAK